MKPTVRDAWLRLVFVLVSLGACAVLPSPPPLPGEHAARAQALRPRAMAGDSLAQTQLAVIHLEGRGVERDPAEALRWFRAAADQDCAVAQLHLGLFHLRGEVVPKDLDLASTWLRRAAEHDRGEMLDRLVNTYVSGDLPLRVAVAVEWARLGATSLAPPAE